MTPGNLHRSSRVKLWLGSGALLAAGAAFWLFSRLAIDHLYGSICAALGALGLAFHKLRPPVELRLTQDALVVSGRAVPWAEVDASELKERRRGALRLPVFELMIKDPARDTGRRTIEVVESEWPRFDELYDGIREACRAAKRK